MDRGTRGDEKGCIDAHGEGANGNRTCNGDEDNGASTGATHMEARAFRGAWIAARTGQTQWKPALESVIGGTWAGARRDEGKRTDTDKGVEQAVRVVQAAAGALLLRWHKMGQERGGGRHAARQCGGVQV